MQFILLVCPHNYHLTKNPLYRICDTRDDLLLGFLYKGVTLTPHLALEFLLGVIPAPYLQHNYIT